MHNLVRIEEKVEDAWPKALGHFENLRVKGCVRLGAAAMSGWMRGYHVDDSAQHNKKLHECPILKRLGVAAAAAAARDENCSCDGKNTNEGHAQQGDRAPFGALGKNEKIEGDEADGEVSAGDERGGVKQRRWSTLHEGKEGGRKVGWGT